MFIIHPTPLSPHSPLPPTPPDTPADTGAPFDLAAGVVAAARSFTHHSFIIHSFIIHTHYPTPPYPPLLLLVLAGWLAGLDGLWGGGLT